VGILMAAGERCQISFDGCHLLNLRRLNSRPMRVGFPIRSESWVSQWAIFESISLRLARAMATEESNDIEALGWGMRPTAGP